MDAAASEEIRVPTDSRPFENAPAQGVEALDHAEPRRASEDGRDAPTPGIIDAPTPGGEDGEPEAVKPGAGDEGAESEAETLIDSPVKKREAERAGGVKIEDAAKVSDILPPPPLAEPSQTPGSDADAPASPVESVEMGDGQAASRSREREEMDGGKEVKGGDGEDSESLSEVSSPRESGEGSSGGESQSRTQSEPRERKSLSPNSRKRKHRASSAGLPNKRQSLQHAQRKLRGLYSEGQPGERSPSPKLRSHRRAVSTQSSIMEGTGDSGSGRKRRAATHMPAQEVKSARPGWEESDASSETSRYGHNEVKRSARHIGRSTSTPGRPVGREHKRHVNKYGFTRLAEACESGDIDLVKEWRQRDPEQLELAEFAGNTPLQIAALNGNADVVEYLISEGCKIDSANVDKDTPLIDAAENGHIETVEILLKAGVDPLRQNLKGQQALDVVNDETDNAGEIRTTLRDAVEKWNSTGARQKREEEEERHRLGPSKELHFMARSYENLLKLVTINDRNGVREFLDARVPVDNTTIAAAAKTGDSYLLNMLLAEMTEKKAHQKPEKPMLSVLGTSHYEMVKTLAELDQFNALWQTRQGKSWPQLAEERQGPNWKVEVELLQRLYDEAKKKRDGRGSSSSPVSRRDGGPRRPAAVDKNGARSDEDEEPAKPKHGPRRLMSRRDMRAAAGKNVEESESEEGEISEGGLPDAPPFETAHVDQSMKPPGSPNNARRARTNSISMQSPEAVSSPKQNRRRTSSLRDAPLPSLEEKAEDDEQAKPLLSEEAKHADNAAHAKFELEQVARLEEKRKEEEAAAATAKVLEEERKAAAQRAAAEEESRRRKQEEEEQHRQALEAESQRRQAEASAARRLEHRIALLDTLPGGLRYVLDPDSDFDYQNPLCRDFLTTFCTPLQVVRGRDIDESCPDEGVSDLWTLNLCAAPLLGKEAGLELLLSSTNTTNTTTSPSPSDDNETQPSQWNKRPIPSPINLHSRLWPALSHLKVFHSDSLNLTNLYTSPDDDEDDDGETALATDDEAGESLEERRAAVNKKRCTAYLDRLDRETADAKSAAEKMTGIFSPESAAGGEGVKSRGEGDDEVLPDAPQAATTPLLPLRPEFILLSDVLARLHPLLLNSINNDKASPPVSSHPASTTQALASAPLADSSDLSFRIRADVYPLSRPSDSWTVEEERASGFFERLERAGGRHPLCGTGFGPRAMGVEGVVGVREGVWVEAQGLGGKEGKVSG
ncbi:hypothetical protein MBLNU230_g6566t1 [Neophaeotheca triangularis]